MSSHSVIRRLKARSQQESASTLEDLLGPSESSAEAPLHPDSLLHRAQHDVGARGDDAAMNAGLIEGLCRVVADQRSSIEELTERVAKLGDLEDGREGQG